MRGCSGAPLLATVAAHEGLSLLQVHHEARRAQLRTDASAEAAEAASAEAQSMTMLSSIVEAAINETDTSVESMDLEEAKRICEGMAGCHGFTFQYKAGLDEPVTVHFKSQESANWSSAIFEKAPLDGQQLSQVDSGDANTGSSLQLSQVDSGDANNGSSLQLPQVDSGDANNGSSLNRFHAVDGGSDRACLADIAGGDSELHKHLVVAPSGSLADCQSLCLDMRSCAAIGYEEARNSCMLWQHPVSMNASVPSAGSHCYALATSEILSEHTVDTNSQNGSTSQPEADGAQEDVGQATNSSEPVLQAAYEFHAVDGGVNRSCAGDSSTDHADDYFQLASASSVRHCEDLCTRAGNCSGVEFHAASSRCEVWTRPGGIGFSSHHKGAECRRLVVKHVSARPGHRAKQELQELVSKVEHLGAKVLSQRGHAPAVEEQFKLALKQIETLGHAIFGHNDTEPMNASNSNQAETRVAKTALAGSVQDTGTVVSVLSTNIPKSAVGAAKANGEAIQAPTSPSSLFEPVDGGEGRGCSGSFSSDLAEGYFHSKTSVNLDDCKHLCAQEQHCQGINYDGREGRCDIWTRPLGIQATSLAHHEVACYRKVAERFSSALAASAYEDDNQGKNESAYEEVGGYQFEGTDLMVASMTLDEAKAACIRLGPGCVGFAALQSAGEPRDSAVEIRFKSKWDEQMLGWTSFHLAAQADHANVSEAARSEALLESKTSLRAPAITGPTALLAESTTIHHGSEDAVWEPIDGGNHRACRGSSARDTMDWYYALETANDLASCKKMCMDNMGCKGVQYNEEIGMCQVWTREQGIGSTSPAKGYLCLRFHREAAVPRAADEALVQLQSQVSPAAGFTVHEGYNVDGGDLWVGMTTVQSAQEQCFASPGCRGFAVHGPFEDGAVVEVRFKSHVLPEGAPGWVSFRRLEFSGSRP